MRATNQELYRPRGLLDVLQLPLIGRLLKWRWGRLALQLPLFIIAVLLVFDGFTGPQTAARNLATVAPWVHYRGLVVVVLLLAGNLFCMGCPRALRNKWGAIAGLFLIFLLYEWLDLWSSPLLTAWVIVAYFLASFVLEAVFTESAFCKYVCPLGTFNFVYSTASPAQISVKNADVCRTCVGKECVNGSYAAQPVIRLDEIAGGGQKAVKHGPQGTPGCGTLLFPPQMTSNLECTMCLDCVRACPHDNVGLMLRTPGRELLQPGAWPRRWDVSLLVIILTVMGLTNAFGMVPPVYDLQIALADVLNTNNELLILLLIFGATSIVLPVGVTLLAGTLARLFTNTMQKYSLRETVAAFAPAFVPVGLGVWIAHYTFHLLIAIWTIIPVFQEFLGQTGEWERFGGATNMALIGLIQLVAMLGGVIWSLYIAQKVSFRLYRRDAMLGFIPWALFLIAVAMIAIWIFGLPMEMRGSVLMS